MLLLVKVYYSHLNQFCISCIILSCINRTIDRIMPGNNRINNIIAYNISIMSLINLPYRFRVVQRMALGPTLCV